MLGKRMAFQLLLVEKFGGTEGARKLLFFAALNPLMSAKVVLHSVRAIAPLANVLRQLA